MIDNQRPEPDDSQADHSPAGNDAYVAPALEVLGSVAEITRGPTPDPGDTPTGVISF